MDDSDFSENVLLGEANRRAHRAEREAAKAQVVIMAIESWLALPAPARISEAELSEWLRTHWPTGN